MHDVTLTRSSLDAEERLAASVDRLERRLDRLETSLARVDALAQQASPVLAALTDVADSLAARAGDAGVDVDARLRSALRMVERLTAPETVRTLERTLDMAERAPGFVGTIADTLDGLVERAGEAGIDVNERLHILATVVERLTSPRALASVREVLDHVDVLHSLLSSGVLAEAPVAVVAKAARSLAESCAEAPASKGPWAALRALRDPGVQRAVGFALGFARRFGDAIAPVDAPRRLPPTSTAV
jgi:uncharacterized protein YjgD (DUF1641 family)